METFKAERWDQLVALLRGLGGFAFRGHKKAVWKLESALERSGSIARRSDEQALIERFQRHSSVYLPPNLVPTKNDTLGWLALMQHYGAPTRFLDFTRSPYVAIFFAFEALPEDDAGRVLYALDISHFQRQAARVLEEGFEEVPDGLALIKNKPAEVVRMFISRDRVKAVLPVEPSRYDARQTAQQTIFMVPGTIADSFEDNLKATTQNGFRIIMHERLRADAIDELRLMNVTAATLFPGLDGLGKSMHSFLTLEEEGQARNRRSDALRRMGGMKPIRDPNQD